MKRLHLAFLVLLLLVVASCKRLPKSSALVEQLVEKEQRQTTIDNILNNDVGDILPAKLTDRPEQILKREGYIASYNKELLLPNWVAWHLTAQHTTGSYKRKGHSFTEDDEVPAPRANTYDYQRSGYDRGHMCPSADNRWSALAQAHCFLMTNICPQLHALNDGDWRILEEQCRDWAEQLGDIYIVCGPVLMNKKHKQIGKNKVTVPEAFFKVILCMRGTPRGIGFIYRNEADRHPQTEYVNTIDDVERITGIDFFASLPDDVENWVESQANLEEWTALTK